MMIIKNCFAQLGDPTQAAAQDADLISHLQYMRQRTQKEPGRTARVISLESKGSKSLRPDVRMDIHRCSVFPQRASS